MIFQTAPEYDHLTFGGRYSCAVCGSSKRSGEVIFRPPHADDFDGYFDICSSCIAEAADHLGWASFDTVTGLREKVADLEAYQADAIEQLKQARDAQASLARETVRLQDAIEELNQPYEIPTEFDDDEDGA